MLLEKILPFYRSGKTIYYTEGDPIENPRGKGCPGHQSCCRFNVNNAHLTEMKIERCLELNWHLEDDYQNFLEGKK